MGTEPMSAQARSRLLYYQNVLKKHPGLYRSLLDCREAEPGLTPDEELYLHIWAPVLTEYVEWVLEQALHAGKTRLYFLARDARPMLYIAQELCRARNLPLDCRYLKVSRYALRVPEYQLLGDRCVDRICIGGIRVTPEKILRRGGLGEDEIPGVAARLGLSDRLRQELTYPEILALRPVLANEPAFLEAVYRKSEAARPAALGYLAQEGLLDGTPCALVDSGWVGTLQQTMERLLRLRDPDLRLDGYYFGLYELPGDVDPKRYHSYFFGPRSGLSRKVRFSNCLFETICSSPRGMTLGYRPGSDGFSPVESASPNPNAERLERYGLLLRRYAERYGAQPDRVKTRNAGAKLLCALMGHPRPWEVDAWGGNLFCDDVLEGTLQPVAAPLSEREILDQRFLRKAAIMLGLRSGESHESAWIEGSIVRGGRHVRSDLLHARLYKYFVYLRKSIKSL